MKRLNIRKAIRKIAVFLMTVCLLVGMFPAAVFAIYEEEGDILEYPVTGGNIYYHKNTSNVIILDSDQDVTDVVIPEEIDGIPVKLIDNYAFGRCSKLKSIVIPDSVTSIGKGVFNGCSSLSGISIPESVEVIGESAFEKCIGLKSIIIPGNVAGIADSMFAGCSNLEEIVISEGVTNIGWNAFSGCSSLSSINIPGSVIIIGRSSFENCNLKSVVIEEGVVRIEENAFSGCSSLSKVVIPESVEAIETDVFSGCTSLETAGPIGSGCDYEFGWKERIPTNAFAECRNLISVSIPESVTLMGSYAFENCSSLSNIILPEGLTSVGERTFSGCSNLNSIVLPGGVTEIESYAFSGCENLKSIIIPESVTSVGNFGFLQCDNLKDVYYSGSEEQWSAIRIDSGNEDLTNATIYYNSTGENTEAKEGDYRIDTLNLQDANGQALDNIPSGGFYVDVDLLKADGAGEAAVILATYDQSGKMLRFYCEHTSNMTVMKSGGEMSDADRVVSERIYVENENGTVSEIRVFIIPSLKKASPVCPSMVMGSSLAAS